MVVSAIHDDERLELLSLMLKIVSI